MGTVAKVVSLYKPSTWKEKGLKWTIGMFFVTLVVLNFFADVLLESRTGSF